ncbi:hypothetical protein MMC28_001258 [Mycoblastus sanguinarius]|nr:hypothetical protein [Mycoblastus sanguinarius]
MASIINLSLRGLQFLWTLLIMALVGNMIADAKSGNPSIVNYTMFVAVFGMLSLFYLIAGTINETFSISPIFMIVADALNVIFFLVGGIALAAYLNVHSCGNQSYIHSNSVTNGSDDPGKRCREAQAVTAFLWFGFAAFAGSLVFSALSARGGGAPRGGIRRGGPAMSQV